MNKKGFTLPEVLLVLVISSLLLGLPVFASSTYVQRMEEQLFFEELQSNVTLMKNHALLNGQRTRMQTRPNDGSIRFSVVGHPNHPYNRAIELPDSVAIDGKTSLEYDFVKDTGNLGQFRTIRFSVTEGKMIFSFQLGSGQYKIYKEK